LALRDSRVPDDLREPIRVFNELHPDVVFNVEFMEPPQDIAEQAALITRLMADPPDLLYFSSEHITFEKVDKGAIFADLNGFFDGPRGINKDDYFSNIFTAAQVDGKLYHAPLYVQPNFVFLNTRLFDAIGVDANQITSISVDEEIDYFLQIAAALPNEELYPFGQFNLMYALSREPLYNISTGEVFANTAQMAERLRRALEVPISPLVNYKPERVEPNFTISNADAIRHIKPSQNMMYRFISFQLDLTTFFLEQHPELQFTHPVFLEQGEGNYGFRGVSCYAIMQNAPNRNLAWEFLRFVMEEERFIDSPSGFSFERVMYVPGLSFMATNKVRFENHTSLMLSNLFFYTMHFLRGHGDRSFTEQLEGQEEQLIENTMTFLREAMETINYEARADIATFNSLIYPDIWLLRSGQQDVGRALVNIQNRLELYIAE
jgi:hypothetical protein